MGERVDTFFKELGGFPRALPPKRRRKPTTPQQERRRAWEQEWQTNRHLALQRAGYRCELPGCERIAQVVHHKAGRRVRHANDLSLLLALCNPCHDVVHRYPEQSYANGRLVKPSTVQTCGVCDGLVLLGVDAHECGDEAYCAAHCPECNG